jgi:hypothetical protein
MRLKPLPLLAAILLGAAGPALAQSHGPPQGPPEGQVDSAEGDVPAPGPVIQRLERMATHVEQHYGADGAKAAERLRAAAQAIERDPSGENIRRAEALMGGVRKHFGF